jgi:protocatechuate 3,4-dioxygenase beta subunit
MRRLGVAALVVLGVLVAALVVRESGPDPRIEATPPPEASGADIAVALRGRPDPAPDERERADAPPDPARDDAATSATAGTGTLSVRVVSPSILRDAPVVAGATVRVHRDAASQDGVTDASGVVTFSDLEPGAWQVEARHAGVGVGRTSAHVDAGATFETTLPLHPPLEVSGRVVAEETGAPIGDALVQAWPAEMHTNLFVVRGPGEPPWAETRTGADGTFSLLLEGRRGYRLRAVREGYAAAESDAFHEAPEAPIVLRLARGGTVAGVVVDAAGKGVAGVAVFLVADEDPWLLANPRRARFGGASIEWGTGDEDDTVEGSIWFTSSDAAAGPMRRPEVVEADHEGVFRFIGLALDRDYRALAQARGARGASSAVRLDAREPDARVTVRLEPRSTLTVVLQDSTDGSGTVRLRGPSAGFVGGSTEDYFAHAFGGRAQFRHRRPGDYELTVQAPGWLSISRTVHVAEGEDASLTVSPPSGRIAGRVRALDGSAIEGAQVSLRDGSRSATTNSDARGDFAFRGTLSGAGTVAATHEAYESVEQAIGDGPLVLTMQSKPRLVGRLHAKGALPETIFVHEVIRGSTQAATSVPVAADGTFTAPVTTKGEVMLVIAPAIPCFEAAYAPVVLGPRDFSRELDIGTVTLDAGVTLTGRVADETGRPVEDAEVRAEPKDVDMIWATGLRTRADGRFALDGLAHARLVVRVRHDAYAPATVETDAAGPVEITLRPGARVHGVLLDAKGAVRRSVLRFRPPGSTAFDEPAAVTDDAGAFRSPTLEPGTYEVFLEDDEGNTVPLAHGGPVATVDLRRGEDREVQWRVER